MTKIMPDNEEIIDLKDYVMGFIDKEFILAFAFLIDQ